MPYCNFSGSRLQFNGVDANTLYWEIYEASKAHHFRLESHDDQRYHLELEFVSPLCQYSDILSIQVQSVGGGGAEAVVLPPPLAPFPSCSSIVSAPLGLPAAALAGAAAAASACVDGTLVTMTAT